jgi:group II intron reverse transcriptase/maturase
MLRQARPATVSLTNLIYTTSAKKNAFPHTHLSGVAGHGYHTENADSLMEVGLGATHRDSNYGKVYDFCDVVQGPVAGNLTPYGTTRYPKGRKTHGYGANVVGRNYSTEGLQETPQNETLPIIPNGCEQLVSLWQLNAANPSLVNNKLIHLVSDEKVLLLAYKLILVGAQGNLGTEKNETLDRTSLQMLADLSKTVKAGKFKFDASRRVWIPKPWTKEKRPLAASSPREKIVQKALQLVLEAIYEPSFLPSSHGFRPGKGSHTALRMIDQTFLGAAWVIEADISKCFDTINHDVLLRILAKRVECRKTLALIKSALRAGFLDGRTFVDPKGSGTPQGNVLSPLLCNIYMHELDCKMEATCKNFCRGQRRRNPAATRSLGLMRLARQAGNMEGSLDRKKFRSATNVDYMDPNFTRISYVRYAGDFVIGIAGPRSLATQIMKELQSFLSEILKLELTQDKTLLTHFTHHAVNFLGVSILNRSRTANKPVISTASGKKRRAAIRLSMQAPIRKLIDASVKNGFLRWNKDGSYAKATAQRRLINWEHGDIIRYYQSVINGVLNYYSFVDNRAKLWWIVHRLRYSCALTLTLKHKLRKMSHAFKKFGKYLTDPRTLVGLKLPKTLARTRQYCINPNDGIKALSHRWSNKLTRSSLGRTWA